MNTQEIKNLIAAKIAGQGTMVDAGGALPMILGAILDAIPTEPTGLQFGGVLSDGEPNLVTPNRFYVAGAGDYELVGEEGGEAEEVNVEYGNIAFIIVGAQGIIASVQTISLGLLYGGLLTEGAEVPATPNRFYIASMGEFGLTDDTIEIGNGEIGVITVDAEGNSSGDKITVATGGGNESSTLMFTAVDTDDDGQIETWLAQFNEESQTDFASLYELSEYLRSHRNTWAEIFDASDNTVSMALVALSSSEGRIAALFGSPSALDGNGQLSVVIQTSEDPEPDTQLLIVEFAQN